MGLQAELKLIWSTIPYHLIRSPFSALCAALSWALAPVDLSGVADRRRDPRAEAVYPVADNGLVKAGYLNLEAGYPNRGRVLVRAGYTNTGDELVGATGACEKLRQKPSGFRLWSCYERLPYLV